MRPQGSRWRGIAAVLATGATASVVWLAAEAGAPPIGDGQGGVQKHLVGRFDAPTYVARAPGVGDTIYVVERRGFVEAVVAGHDKPGHFLDIHELTTREFERGFLSIAFDPNYQRNDLFYAYYTNNAGDIRIDEFRANSDTDAAEGSRRRVIAIPHPNAANHNGGTVTFGPGGFMYAATGDGGTGGANAQNKGSLLGKVLRINPHGRDDGDYHVPRGNPFVGVAGRDEIFALGLRNPFRFSFDRRRVLIGDVGEGSWEEVDYENMKSLRRANFGWPRWEGRHLHSDTSLGAGHYERPIYEYPHGFRGHVITGGLVVRNPSLRSLYGRYLYADFSEGDLRSLIPHFDDASGERKLLIHVDNPVAFTRGPHGRIYVASLAGPVYRLRHP